MAVCTPTRVLANTWWPVRVDTEGIDSTEAERILALWLNSTLGLLTLIAARVDTRGPWVEIKKPLLEKLVVLDPRNLSASQRKQLADLYSYLSQSGLERVPTLNHDPVRAEIDEGMMAALGVARDLAALRDLLAAEPLFEVAPEGAAHTPTVEGDADEEVAF